MKALVIGRHTGEIPGVEVVETKAVTFPTTASECRPVVAALLEEAAAAGAVLLFQNTPGQVAVALAWMNSEQGWETGLEGGGWGDGPDYRGPAIGVIISVPGPRPGKVSKNIMTCDAEQVKEAVVFANPRAKATIFADGYDDVAVVSIEVDGPPMPFEFSHIEWWLF